MPIFLTCTNGHKLRVRENRAGQILSCPACGAQVAVPADSITAEDGFVEETALPPEPRLPNRRSDKRKSVNASSLTADDRNGTWKLFAGAAAAGTILGFLIIAVCWTVSSKPVRRVDSSIEVHEVVTAESASFEVETQKSSTGVAVDDLSEVAAKLQRIGFGLLNYHDTYRSFAPPRLNEADVESQRQRPKPTGLSWRVHILPFVEQAPLYKRFHLDEPWDSPHNQTLIEYMPDVYRLGTYSKSETRIQVITGPGMLFGQKKPPRMRDVSDGPRHTIMALVTGPERAIVWTKPDQLILDPETPVASLGTIAGKYVATIAVNGELLMLPRNMDAGKFVSFATPNGNEIIDGDFYRREFEESRPLTLRGLFR